MTKTTLQQIKADIEKKHGPDYGTDPETTTSYLRARGYHNLASLITNNGYD